MSKYCLNFLPPNFCMDRKNLLPNTNYHLYSIHIQYSKYNFRKRTGHRIVYSSQPYQSSGSTVHTGKLKCTERKQSTLEPARTKHTFLTSLGTNCSFYGCCKPKDIVLGGQLQIPVCPLADKSFHPPTTRSGGWRGWTRNLSKC